MFFLSFVSFLCLLTASWTKQNDMTNILAEWAWLTINFSSRKSKGLLLFYFFNNDIDLFLTSGQPKHKLVAMELKPSEKGKRRQFDGCSRSGNPVLASDAGCWGRTRKVHPGHLNGPYDFSLELKKCNNPLKPAPRDRGSKGEGREPNMRSCCPISLIRNLNSFILTHAWEHAAAENMHVPLKKTPVHGCA